MRNRANVEITATDKTALAIAKAKKNLNGLSKSAGGLFATLGVGLSTAALAGFTKEVINYGSSITDAATATNTGIEELQALRYAAQEAGAGTQQLDNALIRSQKSAMDAANGLSTAKRAFAQLNIDVDSFIRLPTEQKLTTIGRAVATAKNKQQAYAAAMDILGSRNAPRLMEVLQRLGTEGFDKLASSARAAGQVMSSEVAIGMDKAADKMAKVTTLYKTFYAELLYKGAVRGGALTDLSIEIEDTTNKLKKASDDLFAMESGTTAGKAMLLFGANIRLQAQQVDALTEKLKKLHAQKRESLKAEKELAAMRDQIQLQVDTSSVTTATKDVTALLSVLDKMENEGVVSLSDRTASAMAAMDAAADSAKQNVLELSTSAELVNEAFRNVSNEMTDAIMQFAEDGAGAFDDFVGNVLKSMARLMVQQGVNNLLVGIGGAAADQGGILGSLFGGFKADGGAITAGKSYVVGERGPEIIHTKASGNVIPNKNIGQAPPVNNNVNFTIQAIDTSSATQVIAQNRDQIIAMIDQASNQQGQRGITR